MNINNVWAEILIEEMRQHGINHFFIAPGSRSAPLTLACAANKGVQTHIHFDERGLAYYALGYIKASKKPAAVITTSGTAVANLLPAVTEAFLTRIPLILLTADRPRELIDCGANQAIRQAEIFKDFTGYHSDLAEPADRIHPKYVQETAAKIAQIALTTNLPVHLNCPFAEPLYPAQGEPPASETMIYMQSCSKSQMPAVEMLETVETSALNLTSSHKKLFQKPGIILSGCIDSKEKAEAVLKLAHHLNWYIFPDPQSQLRQSPETVMYADFLLDSEDFFKMSAGIETLLIIGGRFISKNFTRLIRSMDHSCRILLTENEDIQDPDHKASMIINMKITDFAENIIRTVEGNQKRVPYLKLPVSDLNSFAESNMDPDEDKMNEPAVIRYISGHLPGSLFLGNSLPARIFSKFAGPAQYGIPKIYANRGASGIDGVTAAACGIADYEKEQVTLITGDTSALHDLNSLALAAEKKLCVIIINNAGGNIFAMLPGARDCGYMEKFFALRHSYSFEHAAALFNLEYRMITELKQLQECFPPKEKTGIVIECIIPWNETPQILEKMKKKTEGLKIPSGA